MLERHSSLRTCTSTWDRPWKLDSRRGDRFIKQQGLGSFDTGVKHGSGLSVHLTPDWPESRFSLWTAGVTSGPDSLVGLEGYPAGLDNRGFVG